MSTLYCLDYRDFKVYCSYSRDYREFSIGIESKGIESVECRFLNFGAYRECRL